MSGTPAHEILADYPPALQLFVVIVLGLYTLVSWGGRLFPSWSRVWSHPNAHTRGHFIEYTAIPTLIFVGAAVAVWSGWNPALPLYGSWEPSRFWGAIGAFCGGMGSLVTARYLSDELDIADARRLTSWIPLLLGAVGFGLLVTSAVLAG